MPAITKMAHSTKFYQSEWTFMDLTILTNYSQFRQSGNQLGGFDDFDEYSPFSLLHAFLDISHLWSLFKMFVLDKKEPTEDENKGDKGRSGDWSWTNTLPPTRRKLVVPWAKTLKSARLFCMLFFNTAQMLSWWCNSPKSCIMFTKKDIDDHTIQQLKTGNIRWIFHVAKIMELFLFTWVHKKWLTFLFS